MTAPITIRLFQPTPAHLRAIIEGGKSYEEKFGIAVASGVPAFLVGPEVSEAFLTRLREEPAPDPWRDGFGIVQLAENRLIGFCSFNGPPDDEGAVEISYGIAPGYEGRGYATEAAGLILAHAFADDRVQRVYAHTLPHATASTRVLQKCGFKDYSELVDPIDGSIWRWEMARSDFVSRSGTPAL
jgi:ribosomal-protein-alanine N-acetyltransferase